MISLYDILEAANGQLFGEPATQIFTDFSFDSRAPQDSSLYVALRTDRGDGHQHMQEAVANGATGLLCTNPPTFDTDNLSIILVKDPQAALTAWTRYILAKYETYVIAIAGTSNTALTAEATRLVLSTRYDVHHRANGHSGQLSVPHTLARLTPEHQFVILELDPVLPGDISHLAEAVAPKVGVITDIGSAHLDQFGSKEAIVEEVESVLARLQPGGLAVVNYADAVARRWVERTQTAVATIAIDEFSADLMAYNLVPSPNGTGFDLRRGQQRFVGRWTPLLGESQVYCLLRALAVGLFFDIGIEEGLKALRNLSPLPGRMNPLKGPNGTLIVDDSYDAEPETMLAALDWLQAVRDDGGRAIFVMGDMDNLGPASTRSHRLVGQKAAEIVDLLITEGMDAAHAGRAALDNGMHPARVHMTHNPADIAGRLRREEALSSGDIVLVKGGASARMERVTQALLADPADAARLPRREGTSPVVTLAQPRQPSWVEIDLDALANNVRRLKALVGPNVALNAVVKANAYGAGAVSVARTALLNGADWLAVASMNEALELREAGIEAPILVMSYTAPAAVRAAIRQGITITVYDLELARAYDREARNMGGRLSIHVKIDTGMGRLGVMPDVAIPFFRQLLSLKNLNLEGIYTHFSLADEDADFTADQVRIFKSIVKPLRASGFQFRHVHAANSAGTLASAENHLTMVRVGLAMHGVSPSPQVPIPPGFRPVLSWKTFVAQVKTLPPGHPVGYGATYVTGGEERIAILPVGYSDGFRRGPSNWGEVLVHGQRAPVIGRVSMEKTAINVTHIPGVTIGDEVVLVGAQGDDALTVEAIADALGTISYEVLCAILPRVPRR